MKTSTAKFSTTRADSSNLATSDIGGAVPKLHGSVPMGNRQPWNLSNKDIDLSCPRNLHIGLEKAASNLAIDDIPGARP